MKIIKFPQAKDTLPNGAPVAILKQGEINCFITCWKPSEEDKKVIAEGREIFLQTVGQMPPSIIYCLDKEGKPMLDIPNGTQRKMQGK